MKKFLILGVLSIMFIGLAACDESTETEPVSDSNEMMGISTMATVGALGGIEKAQTAANQSDVTQLNVTDGFDVLDSIDELQEYLDMVRTFMGTDESFEVDVHESDMDEYEYLMVIGFVNMNGQNEAYELHYNETIVDEDDDDEDGDDEFETTIEGILTIGDTVYDVTGEREVDQGEEEFEMTARIDDENYVTIAYEVERESDENEFELEIEIFVDNQLFKSVVIEFEQEEEETELELFFLEGDRESEYEFEIEEDGNETTYEIEFKITDGGNLVEEGDIEILVVYDEQTDEYTVTYTIETKSGESIVIEGEEEGEEEDEEENEEEDEEDDDDEVETETTTV